MDPQTLVTCLIAVTLLTLTPGVDTMLIIRNSARGGWHGRGSEFAGNLQRPVCARDRFGTRHLDHPAADGLGL